MPYLYAFLLIAGCYITILLILNIIKIPEWRALKQDYNGIKNDEYYIVQSSWEDMENNEISEYSPLIVFNKQTTESRIFIYRNGLIRLSNNEWVDLESKKYLLSHYYYSKKFPKLFNQKLMVMDHNERIRESLPEAPMGEPTNRFFFLDVKSEKRSFKFLK